MGCWPRFCTRDGLQACLDRKDFKPQSLRGLVLGITLTITMAEATAYRLIQQDVAAGVLPYYTPEILVLAFSIFEALLAPFISWWGYQRRRTMMMWFSLIMHLCYVTLFFIPNPEERNDSALCDAQDNVVISLAMSSRSIARLLIILFTCTLFIIIRVACWSHGVAYIDEYSPDRASMHFGVVLVSRVIILKLAYRNISGIQDSYLYLHMLPLVIGSAVNVIQVPFVIPKVVPEVDGVQMIPVPMGERGFFVSIGRVLSRTVAILQMLAMGLMAAALWGFGYHEGDIIKERFYLFQDFAFADIVHHVFIIAVIAFAGVKASAPIVQEYCNLAAIKKITILSIISCIIYIVLTTVPGCDRGEIAGLSQGVYRQPECSLTCSAECHDFNPVCVVEQMVTYVSPCQAGCANSTLINGVQVYTNCTCSPSGRVLAGACRYAECKEAERYHSIMFIIVVTFTLLVFQSQGVLILRTVDRRDKSIAMGLTWSMVATIAFVCGHLLFNKIQAMTCALYGEKGCYMHKGSFPYYVGGTSAILTIASILISIISRICIQKFNKK